MPSEAQKEDSRANRRARTAQELVDAAQRVLAAKGYHGAKIADIAREAGVGVGTFYLYYPTKEAVFLQLVEEAVSQLKVRMDEASRSTTDPAAVSSKRIQVFFNFAAERRNLFRILFGHDASFHDIVRHAQEMFVADIVDNLQGGMDSGVFRKANPELCAQAIVGMCIQAVAWWVDNDTNSVDDVASAIVEFAQKGIMANHGSGKPSLV